MLCLYSGTPGSYKSYHAVCDILSWIRQGKNVISNFPVNLSYLGNRAKGHFTFVMNSDLTVNYLLSYAQNNHHKGIKAQTLVVIDEASIMFNSREIGRNDRMAWVKFFANHRHFNFDINMIAQNDRMIDRQIRSCIETEYKHRALKNYNLFMLLLSLFCGGLYMVVEYWAPARVKVSSNIGKFNKKKADCYDTMALFNISESVQMSEQPTRIDNSLKGENANESTEKEFISKADENISLPTSNSGATL